MWFRLPSLPCMMFALCSGAHSRSLRHAFGRARDAMPASLERTRLANIRRVGTWTRKSAAEFHRRPSTCGVMIIKYHLVKPGPIAARLSRRGHPAPTKTSFRGHGSGATPCQGQAVFTSRHSCSSSRCPSRMAQLFCRMPLRLAMEHAFTTNRMGRHTCTTRTGPVSTLFWRGQFLSSRSWLAILACGVVCAARLKEKARRREAVHKAVRHMRRAKRGSSPRLSCRVCADRRAASAEP